MAKGRWAGLRSVILGLAMAAGCCAAHAQQAAYPAKPVSIIIAAAAGNSPDVAARIVADALTQLWKQQVLIVNRPAPVG